jgi:hypothetical protein
VHPHSHYIKPPPPQERWRAQHNNTVCHVPPFLSPWCAGLSTSLYLPLAWPPEGLHRSETTTPLHAVVLRSFWIPFEAIYFRNLSWIGDSGGHRDHRMCVSTRRCRSFWRQSRCTKFFNELEVGYVGFINIACAGALIPRSVFKGMSPNTSLPLQHY